MSNSKKVSLLFKERPNQWGLRGDPYLWEEMENELSDTDFPNTIKEFTSLIEAIFEKLTGFPITCRDNFFIEKYGHGGMSSGYICPEFWRGEALPLLQRRYKKHSRDKHS